MSRFTIALFLLLSTLGLSACQSSDEPEAAKPAEAPAAIKAPSSADDNAWKTYLQQVVGQNMAGVTDRVYPYYLPANSTVPTPGDPDGKSQYDRQLDNVGSVIQRTVLPGNMLVFGSPDSAKMADLIIAACQGADPAALKGSRVLFIGQQADNGRVQTAVEATGAKYVFVEAK